MLLYRVRCRMLSTAHIERRIRRTSRVRDTSGDARDKAQGLHGSAEIDESSRSLRWQI